jgi:hypothetical protein
MLFNEFQLLKGFGTLSIHKSEFREVVVVPPIFAPLNYDQISCQAELVLSSDLFQCLVTYKLIGHECLISAQV